MTNDMTLSDRMKLYEKANLTKIESKMPAIIRLDGKAFHTWTKGLEEPFDALFYAVMAHTAKHLVNEIQGAVLAYGQSDEISIFLKDYTNDNTDAWFGGSVQKIVSVSASMATAYFNDAARSLGVSGKDKPAFFDSRIFTLPKHEVTNYFIWRQQDFMRNSVQMVARYHLGHSAIHGISRSQMIDALLNMEEPVDYYRDIDALFRHGYSYVRGEASLCTNLPNFVECRDYIEVHVY